MKVQLKDIMSKDLTTVGIHTPVSEIATIFSNSTFHHIPVVDKQERLKGIVSKTDFERIKSGISLFRNPKMESYNKSLFRTLLTSDIMTADVKELQPDDSIELAYREFKNNVFRALPIVDKGKLVGIVTPLDLLDFFFQSEIV